MEIRPGDLFASRDLTAIFFGDDSATENHFYGENIKFQGHHPMDLSKKKMIFRHTASPRKLIKSTICVMDRALTVCELLRRDK